MLPLSFLPVPFDFSHKIYPNSKEGHEISRLHVLGKVKIITFFFSWQQKIHSKECKTLIIHSLSCPDSGPASTRLAQGRNPPRPESSMARVRASGSELSSQLEAGR